MVLAGLLAVALALIITDYLGGSAPLRAIGSTVFGTAERGLSSVTSPVATFFDRGGDAARLAARVRSLQRELVRLRAQLSEEQLSRAEYAQLAPLLKQAGDNGNRIVAANVIAVGQGYEQTVTLDAGSSDGVRPDETVLNGAGLVGKVTSVGPWSSTVLLATDATAVAGVRLAGSGQMGWVAGAGRAFAGGDVLRLHVLGPDGALQPGQRLVTSASVGDRPYVPGIPVGVVTRVQASSGALTQTALVRPYVNFAALDIVGVVVPSPRHRGRG
jgi:rod shape-determining protein MreC